VTKPIEGAQKGGIVGFGKGVLKGVIGVAVKPITGAMVLITKTGEGFKNTAQYFEPKKMRYRYPRYFGADKILTIYNSHYSIVSSTDFFTTSNKIRSNFEIFTNNLRIFCNDWKWKRFV